MTQSRPSYLVAFVKSGAYYFSFRGALYYGLSFADNVGMKIGKNYIICLLLYGFVCIHLGAQGDTPLPTGYGEVELGMSLADAKAALEGDYRFGYRGERDVSLLPTNRTLIETSSDNWLERCWFQFYKDKLYTIIINFNPEKMDYYSLFSELVSKYGEPLRLSPKLVVWENDVVTVSLERPLSIKYIDRIVFDELFDQKLVDESTQEMLRSRILEDL